MASASDLRARLADALAAYEWKRIALNTLLIVMSVNVAMAGLELSLRHEVIDDGVKVCEGTYNPSVFHPTYGWTGNPDTQKLRQFDENEYELYTHNDEGFRDTYDTGDESVVMLGELASDNTTFPHLLDRWSDDTAVHNYAFHGYGTAQQLLVYRDVTEEIDEKAVVLGYYRNDPGDNVHGIATRPQFERRNGSLVQTASPKPNTGLITNPLAQRIQTFLIHNTAMYNYLKPYISRIIRGGGQVGGGPSAPPTGEALEERLALTRSLVTAIGDEAADQNATLVVLYLPSRTEINPQFDNEAYLSAYNENAAAQRAMLAGVAANNSNVAFVDATTYLEGAQTDRRLYGERNAHMDDYGHRMVARGLYRDLVDRGILDNGTAPDFDRDYSYDGTSCPG